MNNEIHVVSELTDEYAYWNIQLLESINERAAEKKCTVRKWALEDLATAPLCDPVLVMNLSSAWGEEVLRQLELRGMRSAMLSVSGMPGHSTAGSIVLDHRGAARDTARYLYALGKKRIAFVGDNRRSPNDQEKRKGIEEMANAFGMTFTEQDVFYFSGDVAACIDCFVVQAEPYDAVICANDICAILLIKNTVLAQKKRIPDDMYVVSFGNSLMAQLIRPSLTTLTLDYRKIGKVAVDNVLYLRKNPEISALHTAVHIRMQPGASTAYKTVSDLPMIPSSLSGKADYQSFYRVKESTHILRAEALLTSLDATDLYILYLLFRGEKLASMAEKTFLSESTCKYRIRRMQQKMDVSSREALVDYLSEWVDPDALKLYITKHVQ